MSTKPKPWWYPQLADEDFVQYLRDFYSEETAGLDDDYVLAEFNPNGGTYAVTWDHVGDAYRQFEPLADAFLKQELELKKLRRKLKERKP